MSASSPESSPDPSHAYSTEGFTPVYVKAWGALSLPFTLNANESAYWEFRTQAHDIAFGVEFVESTNGSKKTTVEPMTRIPKPDQLLQHGSYQAKQAGTLTLTWDNTYSKLRGKNLLYRVRVLAPEVDHNALPFGDVRLTPYGPATIEGVREEDGIFIVSLPYGQGYFTSSTLLQSPTLARPPSINERCLIGVNMFFNNRVWESESFFRKDVEKYPIFSLAYGSLGFLRALMTWDKSDIGEANSRLKQTRHFVAALLPQVSTMKSVGRFFARSNGPTMTPQELECSLLQAEAYLLQAMLLFTDESYMSFIKAGLKIRSAWKLYEKCDEQVRCYDESTRASLDASVVGGIKFGIGCFNVIISILPSIILRVVSALGFPSDRALGLRLLTECSNVVGVRQPLAYLMLSFVYVIMPSFFTVRPKHHIKNATDVLNQAYKQYPSGALFLWMDGRLQRLKRDLPQAIQRFTRSAQGQPDWLQLQHLCAYELGFCYFFSLDFVKSSAYWARLEKENTWSKGFFAYMQGICEMSSDHGLTKTANESDADFKKRLWSAQQNAAPPILSKVESLVTRKFGGKPLAIEAFVVHRSNMFVKENRRPAIPELEMIYLFYGFIQMSEPLLDKSLQMVDTVLRDARSPRPDGGQPLTTEEVALVLLVRAAILKALHRWNEAKAILTELDRKKDVEFTAEKYVLPFSRFELAALLMEQVVEKDAAVADGAAASIDQSTHTMAADGWSTVPSGGDISPIGSSDWEEARLDLLNQAHAILKKCESNKTDYPFKNRLHLRIHLASVELSMMKKHWQEIGSVYSSADLKGDEEAIKAVVDSEEEEEGKE